MTYPEIDNWFFFEEGSTKFVSYDYENLVDEEDILTVHNNSFILRKNLWTVDIGVASGDNVFSMRITIHTLEKAIKVAEEEYLRIRELIKTL